MYSHGQQFIHSSPIVVLAEERKCLCLCDMPEFGWRWRNGHRMTRQEAQREPTKNRSSKFYSSLNRNMKLVMRAVNTLRPTHTQGGQNKKKQKNKKHALFAFQGHSLYFCGMHVLICWLECWLLHIFRYFTQQTRLCSRKMQSGPL